MKFTKKLNLLLILVVLVLATACGGSADSGSEVAAEVESPTEEPAIPAGDPAAGAEVYGSLCFACHGEGAVGVEGLGLSLVESEFVASQSDEELLAFVKVGRSVTDPENVTGVDMPPKGGNPALSDDDILNVIAYIRSISE